VTVWASGLRNNADGVLLAIRNGQGRPYPCDSESGVSRHGARAGALKSGCKAIVTAQRFKSSDYLEMLRSVAARLPALRFMIHLGEESQPGMIAFSEVSLREDPAERKRIGELAKRCN